MGPHGDIAERETNKRKGTLSQCSTHYPSGSSGGSGNSNPANQRCVSDCGMCTRDGLRCTSSIDCPVAAGWLCY
jgi:hypothetical protein